MIDRQQRANDGDHGNYRCLEQLKQERIILGLTYHGLSYEHYAVQQTKDHADNRHVEKHQRPKLAKCLPLFRASS